MACRSPANPLPSDFSSNRLSPILLFLARSFHLLDKNISFTETFRWLYGCWKYRDCSLFSLIKLGWQYIFPLTMSYWSLPPSCHQLVRSVMVTWPPRSLGQSEDMLLVSAGHRKRRITSNQRTCNNAALSPRLPAVDGRELRAHLLSSSTRWSQPDIKKWTSLGFSLLDDKLT